jgi:putative lipoprotein
VTRPALLAAAAVLAACAQPAPRGAVREPDFVALGQEPGWRLTLVENGEIVLDYDYGTRRAVFATPEPILPRWNGEIYETTSNGRSIRVEIRRGLTCRDTMSGAVYPTIVTVVIDGTEFKGCGGPPGSARPPAPD